MSRVRLTALALSIVALQVTVPALRINAEENPVIAQTPQTQTDPRLAEADRSPLKSQG